MTHTRTKSSPLNNGFCLLSLQAYIEFKVIDVTVEFLSGVSDLRVWIPFFEASIGYSDNEDL